AVPGLSAARCFRSLGLCVGLMTSGWPSGHAGGVSRTAPEFVKVRFSLQRVDGWPPVESEGVWAEPLGGDLYRVDNTPWFIPNLGADDVVKALAGSDGVLWAIERERWAGRLTIRVIPSRSGPLQGDRQAVLDAFSPL